MAKSITSLTSVAFVGALLGRGLDYVLRVLIARGLGAEALGEFVLALVVLQLAGSLAMFGLNTTAQRYIPVFRSDGDDRGLSGFVALCFISPLITGLVFSVSVFYGLQWFDAFSSFSENRALQVLVIGIPLYAVFHIGEAATRGYKETKYSVYIRDIGQSTIATLLAGIGIYLFSSIHAVAVAYLISLGFASVLSVVFLYRLGAFDRVREMTVNLSEIYTYSLPVAVAALTSQLLIWTDILMLGVFVSPQQVGYYEAAYRTAVLITFALVSVNAIFPSIAAELYNNENLDELNNLYTVVTKWVTFFTVFAGFFFVIFAGELLSVFGENFDQARLVLIVVTIGQGLTNLVGPAGYLLLMSNNERLQMWNAVFISAINIGLNYVLIQEFGIIGAGLATACSVALINILRLAEVRVLLGLWPYSRQYARAIVPLGLAAVIMILGDQVSVAPLVRLLGSGFVAGVVFMLTVIPIAYTEEDRLLVASIQ